MTRPYTSVWNDLNQVEFRQASSKPAPTGPDTYTPETPPNRH